MTDVDDLVRSVARRTWSPPVETAPPIELTGAEWTSLQSRMFAGNVGGLLADAVDAGHVRVEAQARSDLVDRLLVRLVNDLRAERECLSVTHLLRNDGVDSIVLKGLAVAHLDYASPAHRSSNDVDLLVHPDDIERATTVLRVAGYRRDLPERRPGFDRRFAKDVTMYGPNRVEIDLHRTLLRGPFGAAIDLDELWAHRQPLEVRGLPPREALDKPSRLLHAAYTVVVADARPTLATFFDVAALAGDPEMDWRIVRERAARWRAHGIVSEAITAAMEVTGVALDVHQGGAAGRSSRRWRRLYVSGGGSLFATTAGTVLALPAADRLRFLRAVALPSTAYRRARRQAGRRSESRAALQALRPRYRGRTR